MKAPNLRALHAALLGCLAAGILCIDGLSAAGSTLNLQPQDPDLNAGFLSVQYTPSAGSLGTLTVNGFPLTIALSSTGTTYTISSTGGTIDYQLTAQINENTGQATSGSLDIGGTISPIATSGTLLTGTLANFGFQNSGGDVFGFVFNITGGDLAPYYHSQVAVNLTATGSGFTGSFTTPFATSAYAGVADNFYYTTSVPEPSAGLILFGATSFLLLVCKCHRGRWRKRYLNSSLPE